jgi:hypothetical protein
MFVERKLSWHSPRAGEKEALKELKRVPMRRAQKRKERGQGE